MSDFSIAMTDELDLALRTHLIREDGEEDLAFALYAPSNGHSRITGLLNTIMLPTDGDRQRHGNVSFNRVYVERTCREALSSGLGIAFLHSHPAPGWQAMSRDDIAAERRIADVATALTSLPFFGLTVGNDGSWSARAWTPDDAGGVERHWCESVRVVGRQLKADFADELLPPPEYREEYRRTATVWGAEKHQDLARLRVGVVGLGSVGSLVAESLARMGMTRLTLIDPDFIERHNLDRTLGATRYDVGKSKVAVASNSIDRASTAKRINVRQVPDHLANETAYRKALDCDVIFSCVDRPWGRSILNHFAYAHLIPILDGGIDVRFKDGEFDGVDWQAHTVGPGRICLECLGQFTQDDAQTEIEGMLDDPSYMRNLPDDHHLKRNENVFPFSMNLASLEILQFVALATSTGRMEDFGVQRYRFYPGIVTASTERHCRDECPMAGLTATGDSNFTLAQLDQKQVPCRSRAPWRSLTARLVNFIRRRRAADYSWISEGGTRREVHSGDEDTD